MELRLYLVDWSEARRRYRRGTLTDALATAANGRTKWAQALEPDPADYFAFAEAWERLAQAQEAPAGMRAPAAALLGPLITYSGFQNDLEEEPGDFLLAISPRSARRFVELASQVEFQRYREAYYARVPAEHQATLATGTASGQAARSFEEAFLPYVMKWVRTLRAAVKKKRGLLAVLE
jgi:hypothetical protein